MAKLDGESAIKYLALGAGAVVVPSVVGGSISGMVASIPFWGQVLFGTITVGGIVLASLGVGLVYHFVYNK